MMSYRRVRRVCMALASEYLLLHFLSQIGSLISRVTVVCKALYLFFSPPSSLSISFVFTPLSLTATGPSLLVGCSSSILCLPAPVPSLDSSLSTTHLHHEEPPPVRVICPQDPCVARSAPRGGSNPVVCYSRLKLKGTWSQDTGLARTATPRPCDLQSHFKVSVKIAFGLPHRLGISPASRWPWFTLG